MLPLLRLMRCCAPAVEDAAEAVRPRGTGRTTPPLPRHACPGSRCRTARKSRTGRAAPVRATDSYVARRPANTRGTSSLADRHDDRGARVRRRSAHRCRRGARNRPAVAARAEQQEAGERRPETGRDPAEQDREQDEDRDLQRLPTVIGQDRLHHVGREVRLRRRSAPGVRCAAARAACRQSRFARGESGDDVERARECEIARASRGTQCVRRHRSACKRRRRSPATPCSRREQAAAGAWGVPARAIARRHRGARRIGRIDRLVRERSVQRRE